MLHTRRFVFRGNASAASGRIHRPTDVLIDVPGASSLTVAGGVSRSEIAEQAFGPYLRFVRAATLAEGAFDDQKAAIALTERRMHQDAYTTTTRVSAEIEGLVIGGGKASLSVAHLRGALESHSGRGGDEPPFVLPGDVSSRGVTIGGHALAVDIDFDAFRECPTHGSLLKAAGDRRFVAEHGRCFFLERPAASLATPRDAGLRESSGTIFTTIVKAIRWEGAPYPGATIDHHSVVVPDFGTIFFGELLVSPYSRRLTMLRLDLGSPEGGFVACCDVETNGIWAP